MNTSRKQAAAGVTVEAVIFRQFVDDDLGCASYLVGDEETHEAVVVDPAYAIKQYLAAAGQEGVRIVRTLETHTHADHVSGHGRLALEHGVPVSIHPTAEAAYEHDPLEDGQEIVLGNVALRVLHTPGHRPEHCCFAVVDRARAEEPWVVLTGDSLFVGDAARPDLAVEAVDGARELYASLQRLLELPDIDHLDRVLGNETVELVDVHGLQRLGLGSVEDIAAQLSDPDRAKTPARVLSLLA